MELGGEVEGELLDEQVGEVGLLQLGETGRVSPGVEDQRLEDTVGGGEDLRPVGTIN